MDIFSSYNFKVDQLIPFYLKLNEEIRYPGGMTVSLGVVYWGREVHYEAIKGAIPKLKDHGVEWFKDLYEVIRTPGRSRKFTEATGIKKDLLRILKHDLELWLPVPVPLSRLEFSKKQHFILEGLGKLDLNDQLRVVSASQTRKMRRALAVNMDQPLPLIDEVVKTCDFYRTGKNVDYIRARLYFAMGLDTHQTWATQTAGGVIERFKEYIRENPMEGDRLVPWPKEVRNGIEWAKWHLEVFEVEW